MHKYTHTHMHIYVHTHKHKYTLTDRNKLYMYVMYLYISIVIWKRFASICVNDEGAEREKAINRSPVFYICDLGHSNFKSSQHVVGKN